MNKSWEDRIKKRLLEFLEELKGVCINTGRKPENIRILFATKYLNPQQFIAFVDILIFFDIKDIILGENRVQEAGMKLDYLRQERPELRKRIEFMMIGTLQKNKINKAIALFDEIHSIDSFELAKDLDDRLKKQNKTIPVYLEVNISGEKSKHGIKVEEVEKAVEVVKGLKNLHLKGLMTMAPHTEDPDESRPYFHKLKQIASRYGLLTSMGMSSDWRVAIEEESNMVRIGSRVFATVVL